AVRTLVKVLLTPSGLSTETRRPGMLTSTLIYGAGQPGIALLRAIRAARDRNVIGFVDPSPTLWRQYVSDLKVYAPSQIAQFAASGKVQEVLVALPGDRRQERRKALQELERLPVSVKILPTYEDLSSGNVSLNRLRAVEIGDILGR